MPPLLSGKIEEETGLYDAFSRLKDIDISCGVLRIACNDFIGLIGIASSSQIVGAVTKEASAGKLTNSEAVDRMLAMRTGTFEYYEVPQKELTRLDQKLAVDIAGLISQWTPENGDSATAESAESMELDSSTSVEAEAGFAQEAVAGVEPEPEPAASEEYVAEVQPEQIVNEEVEAVSGTEAVEETEAVAEAEPEPVALSGESASEANSRYEADSQINENLGTESDASSSKFSASELDSIGTKSSSSDTVAKATAGQSPQSKFDISELNAIGTKSESKAGFDKSALDAIGSKNVSSKPAFDVSELDSIGAKSSTLGSSFDAAALDAIGSQASSSETKLEGQRATGNMLAKFKQKAASDLTESKATEPAQSPEKSGSDAFDPTSDPLQKSAAETVERIKKYRRPDAELEAEAERAQRMKFASSGKMKHVESAPEETDADKQRIRPAGKAAEKPVNKIKPAKSAPKKIPTPVFIGIGVVAGAAILFFATRGAVSNYFVSSAEKQFDEKKDSKGALSSLAPAFFFDSSNGRAHLLKGKILQADGDKEKAFEEFDQALAAFPDDGDVLRAHASLAFAMKKNKILKDDTDHLLAIDSTAKGDGYWYGLRAKAELGLGQYQDAINDCTTALKLGQKTPWIYSRRGWAYTLNKNPKAGMKDFAAALALPNKDSSETYVGKAQALQALGDLKGALAAFETAFTMNNKVADYYSRRAALYLALKQPDKAMQDFAQALQIDPSFNYAHIGRSEILLGQNRIDEALKELNQVPKKYETPELIYARARANMRKQDYKTAIACFKQGMANQPTINPNTYVDLAYCYAAVNNYKDALQMVQKACDAQPNNANFRALHGFYNQGAGQTVSALGDYERALSLDPKNADAHFWRGGQFEAKGDANAAVQDYEATLAANPNYTEAKKRLASLTKVVRHSSNTSSETASVVDSIKIIPGDFKTLMADGYSKLKSHNTRAAINYFASAVKQDPSSTDARKYLAYALMGNGNNNDAISQFQALASSKSIDRRDTETLGRLLVQNGRPQEAADIYLQMVTENVKDTGARLKLADAYATAGQLDKALKCLEEGKKSNPEAAAQYDGALKAVTDKGSRGTVKPPSGGDSQG